MARPSGLPKTGGRKKGVPNKKTLALQESLDLYGVDVVGQIAELLPQLTIEKRVDALISLMSFLYPKRKAVEIEPPEEETDSTIRIVFVDPDGSERPFSSGPSGVKSDKTL